MGLPDRATAEQLTWACADAIAQRLPKDQAIPEELAALNKALAGTYYANLSIFRSAPDTWAIDQLFPVVPSSSWINDRPDWPTSPISPVIPMVVWIASSEMDNPNSCWSCTNSTATTPI